MLWCAAIIDAKRNTALICRICEAFDDSSQPAFISAGFKKMLLDIRLICGQGTFSALPITLSLVGRVSFESCKNRFNILQLEAKSLFCVPSLLYGTFLFRLTAKWGTKRSQINVCWFPNAICLIIMSNGYPTIPTSSLPCTQCKRHDQS